MIGIMISRIYGVTVDDTHSNLAFGFGPLTSPRSERNSNLLVGIEQLAASSQEPY